MAATRAPRWRALTAVAAGVFLTAACGGATSPDPTASPTPTPAPTLDRLAVGDEYPAEPQPYAEAAVAAWAAPDLLRLADLTTTEVYDQLLDLPGPPDPVWTSIRCDDPEPGATRSDCSFYNADGDHLVLTVDHTLAGEPGAAVAARYEQLSLPTDPVDYVTAFLASWQDGNLARMRHLAEPAAVTAYARVPPAPAREVRPGPAAADPADPVEVVVVLPEATLVTVVDPARLGMRQAIRSAAPDPAG